MVGNPLGLALIAAALLYGLLKIIRRGDTGQAPSTAPQPTKPPEKTLRPAPKFLGFFWLRPWYGKGERIVVGLGTESHSCEDAGPNKKKNTHGLVGNGSGPYTARVTVVDTKTGARMPIYRQWGNNTGPEIQSGEIQLEGDGEHVSGSFVFYALGKCPYVNGSLEACNEFIPIAEYPDGKATAKGKKPAAKACGCGGTDGQGNAVDSPTQPTTTVRVTVVFVNADGVESPPYHSDLVVETTLCN